MNFVDKDGTTKVYIPVHPWNTLLYLTEVLQNEINVAVRVIKIFGTKDNHFSTLGDVTKSECFLSSV